MDTSMRPSQRRVYAETKETFTEVAPTPVAAQPVVTVPVVAEPVPAPMPVVDSQQSYARTSNSRYETHREQFYDANGNLMEREEQIMDDPYTRRLNILDRTAGIVYFLMGVLEVILAGRFLFRLINAQTTNGFVNFLYNFSNPFVAPFNGIFNDQNLSTASTVEVSTIIAMLVYAIITFGIVQLLKLFLTPNPSTRQVFSNTRRRS